MKVCKNFSLKDFNGYCIDATCRNAIFPENEDDIIQAYQRFPSLKLLGSGHNLILSKVKYEEDFLILNGCFNQIELEEENTIRVNAGAFMKDVSVFARDNELSGLEFYYDIPSSLGGAVVMNAGTKEGETSQVITKVRYLDINQMEIVEVSADEADFNYRNSMFQNCSDKVILTAWFNLKFDSKDNIGERMQLSKERRWSKQPRNFPNCGSVFKRPPGKFVGPMIEELGLKGYRIGGAQISEKHAGFIVNVGNATGKDIIELIELIKAKVRVEYNIDLEVEQRIL